MFSLPVLVYHHVNNIGEDITPNQFESQMAFLKEKKYKTIFIKDWIENKVIPNGNNIAITFDDGYVDNWIYAFPILKKYGLKATIFHTTARSMKNLEKRKNLDDVWNGNITEDNLFLLKNDWDTNKECVLNYEGSDQYLLWSEMRSMESTGLIDIQSHSHFHRDFFVSSDIVDFNRNVYFGVGWATDGDTRYGIPIYHRKSAMMARRYFDDVGLRNYIAEIVGGPEYFKGKAKHQYMKEIMPYVDSYSSKNYLKGSFEDKENQKKRIYDELVESRNMIEEKLDKKCSVICWPWGEYSILSLKIAKESGFKGAVTFSPGINIYGTYKAKWHIKRFPPEKDFNKFVRVITKLSNIIFVKHYALNLNAQKIIKKIFGKYKNKELLKSLNRRYKK